MKKIKAFTLLETLIVIMVFCIGILVVVHGLSQTLRNKDYANTQIKSAFFAREGIELVFNLRDANYHKKLPWDCMFQYDVAPKLIINDDGSETSSSCPDYLGSQGSKVLKISMGSGNEYISIETGDMKDFTGMFEDYQIYLHTGNDALNGQTGYYYDYSGTEEEKTGFARYLVITGVTNGDEVIDKDKLLKIESHVLYQRGALTGEKVMETFIGNYDFKQ